MTSRLSSWARDDLLFDVRDSGPVDGEAVVCLHGFPQDGTAYDDVARQLAASGLRVLVPDQRGLRSSYMAGFQLPVLPELTVSLAGGRGFAAGLRRSGLNGERAAHYTTRMREPGAMAAALGWYRSIPVSRGRGAGRVAVPTTYLVGRRDPFFSAASVRRTADLVTGPYRIVELDAGHWLPENCAEDVAEVVRAQVGEGVTPGR